MVRHRCASVVFGGGLALGLLLTAATTPARADHQVFTLRELLAGISVQVCDKIFSNFRDYGSSAAGGASPADPANIRATFLHEDCLNPGIRWSSSSPPFEWQISSSQSQDTFWRYDVTAGPGFLIKDNDLLLGVSFVSEGAGISISETAHDLDGNRVADKSVVAIFGEGDKLSDHRDFPGEQALTILTDIFLVSGANGSATLLDFTQHFSQQVVPEPGSLTLLVLGTAGLIGYRWRRREKV